MHDKNCFVDSLFLLALFFFFFFFFYLLLRRSISDHYLRSCGYVTCSRPQRTATGGLEPGTSRPKVLGFTTAPVRSIHSYSFRKEFRQWKIACTASRQFKPRRTHCDTLISEYYAQGCLEVVASLTTYKVINLFRVAIILWMIGACNRVFSLPLMATFVRHKLQRLGYHI